jgi:hypothetical protein
MFKGGWTGTSSKFNRSGPIFVLVPTKLAIPLKSKSSNSLLGSSLMLSKTSDLIVSLAGY